MSTRLWHPFADMAVIKDDEVVIVRGEGARVWDEQGREYIDAKAALWYANVGHGRTEIAEAAAEQMRTLAGYETFDRAANRPSPRAGRPRRRAGADGGRGRVLRQRRLGRRGHGGQAGAALLERSRSPREARDRPPRALLPRHERLWHQPGRHPRQRRGLRQPDRRRRHRRPGLDRRARGSCSGRAATGSRPSSASR